MQCEFWTVEKQSCKNKHASDKKLRDLSKLTCLNEDKMLAGSSQNESIFLTIEVESKMVEMFNQDFKNIESNMDNKIDDKIESRSLKELDCKDPSNEFDIKLNNSHDELQNLGNCDSNKTVEFVKNSEKKEECEVEKQSTEELNDMLKLKGIREDKMLAGSFQDESVFDTKAVSSPVVAHLINAAEKKVEPKMVEQLNQVVTNIESKYVKIDNNIESRSVKEFDCKCHSHEVNIKLNKSRDDLASLENGDSIESIDIGQNPEEKKENEVKKSSSEEEPKDVLDMKDSNEDKILAGRSQNESTIKTIGVITPVDQPLLNDVKIKAATKMLEQLNHFVKNIESKNVKIDDNIRARSSKDLDFRGYSYEVNIKLNNSRDDLQSVGYCDSIETIDFGENSGEKKEYAFRTRMRSPDYQHKTGVPIPKPSQKLKNKSKTKKNKCKKVSKCCLFMSNCFF